MRITFHAIAQHVIASELPDHFPRCYTAKCEHKRPERAGLYFERILSSKLEKKIRQ